LIDTYRRRALPEQPLITIITSTFNAGDEFSRTAASIRAQTYPHVQWIVADGGSKDRTLELIKENADIVDVWFSERDEGIYDAWNKAVVHVKGQWVQFIGAGDELASPDTLAQMAPYLANAHPTYDIVYGRILLLSSARREPLEEIGKPWSELKGNWSGRKPKLPVHPEVFHHASIFDGNRTFDRRFRIAGDSHLLLRNVLKKDPLYVPVLVDRMPVGGVSDKISSAWNVAREIGLINRDLGIKPPIGQILFDWMQILSKIVLLRVLPKGALNKVADRWRMFLGKKPRFTVE
jgi:glycosyltransferase involved in cell wall biosynthesis